MSFDWSARGWPRLVAVLLLGTAICIAFAFAFDSYSFKSGTWRWGSDPLNNLLIPLLLAPPFLFLLLNKMRQLAIAHHELITIASTDSLTSLLNRRAFTELVEGYLTQFEEVPTQMRGALLAVDVDHFKSVNDRYGHDSGDEALKIIADKIKTSVGDADLVARMGGEEFCVFIPEQSPERIRRAAEGIRQGIRRAAFKPDGHRHPLSVSVGGAIFDRHTPFSELYRIADERLYRAKRKGRDRVELMRVDPNRPAQVVLN